MRVFNRLWPGLEIIISLSLKIINCGMYYSPRQIINKYFIDNKSHIIQLSYFSPMFTIQIPVFYDRT